MEGDQTDQDSVCHGETPRRLGRPATAIEGIRAVGDPVTATDSILDQTTGNPTNAGNTDVYTWCGPDAASFSIDRETAQLISTKEDVPLDTETKDTYTVTVTATDPSGRVGDHHCDHHGHGRGRSSRPSWLAAWQYRGCVRVPYVENDTDAVATYTACPALKAAFDHLVTGSGDDAGDFNISRRRRAQTSMPLPTMRGRADAEQRTTYTW